MNASIISDYNPVKALTYAVRIWFAIVVVGQIIFALYIFGLYGISASLRGLDQWNINAPHGYTPGDMLGTIIFGVHVLLAGVITIGGPLQLMPIIRRKFPRFHRVNGRIYITAAYIISIAGLYLSWVKGSVGGLSGSIWITINAILIMITAYYTIKHAINMRMSAHRNWAIRLFVCMSGVWFFRVFLMLWFVIFKGPYGFDPEAFQGPGLNFLYTCSYVLPIIVVQLYIKAKSKEGHSALAMLICLALLSIAIVVGSVAATMGMWLPSFH